MSSEGAAYDYVETTGVIVPDTADIQTEVGAEFATALQDEQLPTAPDTAQGAMIVAESTARASVAENNAAVANQFNPNEAGGIFLEALCRLTGLEPPVSTPTTIANVPVTGVSTTVIPAGSLVAPDNTGTSPVFQTTGVVTITAGVALVNIQATAPFYGPYIPPAPGAWTIISQVLGWESINTTGAGATEIGTAALSDAALRTLRANTLGLQGVGLVESTISALNDTPGVLSLSFLENVTDAPVTIETIDLVAHSIWACVFGGTDLDVATTLLAAKGLGCNWNGATTVDVTDPSSLQIYPVQFDRPTQTDVWLRVTYKASSVSGSADVADSITQAILDYQAGESSIGPGLGVGDDVSPFEIAAAVASEISGIFITKVEQSLDGVTYNATDLAAAINQIYLVSGARILTVAV